jgi:hypothetical protein
VPDFDQYPAWRRAIELEGPAHLGRRLRHGDAGREQGLIGLRHGVGGRQQEADVEGLRIRRLRAAGQHKDNAALAAQDGHAIVAALFKQGEAEAVDKESGGGGDVGDGKVEVIV